MVASTCTESAGIRTARRRRGARNAAHGSDAAALKSTLAATSAMMESLNQATRQFAALSEATMKAATEQMVRGASKK